MNNREIELKMLSDINKLMDIINELVSTNNELTNRIEALEKALKGKK